MHPKEKGYVVYLYKSPSQTHDEIDKFLLNFPCDQIPCDVNLNPLFVLVAGDSNARAANWRRNNVITTDDTKINSLTSFYSLSQIISYPTHILPNPSSWVDLIFKNEPNLVTESVFHRSSPKLPPINCFNKTHSKN